MAVRGVLAEADVGDEDEAGEGRFTLDGAQGGLDDAIVGPGAGSLLIFGGGQTEEQYAAEAQCDTLVRFLQSLIDGKIEDPGHGGDGLADAFAGHDEERIDQRGGLKVRLADEAAQGFGAAHSSHARDGPGHKASLRQAAWRTYHGEVPLLPDIPFPLVEAGAAALEWPRLREHIAGRAVSPLGRAFTLALEPTTDTAWILTQQLRTADLQAFLYAGGSFDFHGLFDPTTLLDQAAIPQAALEPLELLRALSLAERVAAWRNLFVAREISTRPGAAMRSLSNDLLEYDLAPLLRTLRGKIEPDGSLSDDASPELRRIRRAMESQHRAIEASLRRAARALREEGSSQGNDDIITVRGERFVIPIKAEFKRKVPGVVHGSSSSGQTVFVEPLETIEQNNELVRLLDDEQAEIHRILVALTAALAAQAPAIAMGTAVLAEVESHFVRARFAADFDCVMPVFGEALTLKNARHPLLELRMRGEGVKPVPLTLALAAEARQLIVSGPNTGGKTVSLKTTGLLTLMALAGLPVPADEAMFPMITQVFADIGDAQFN